MSRALYSITANGLRAHCLRKLLVDFFAIVVLSVAGVAVHVERASAQEDWKTALTELCLDDAPTPKLYRLLSLGWRLDEQGVVSKESPLRLRDQRLADLVFNNSSARDNEGAAGYVLLSKGAPESTQLFYLDGALGKLRSVCAILVPHKKSSDFKETCELKDQVEKVIQSAGYRRDEYLRCWDASYKNDSGGISRSIWVRTDNILMNFGFQVAPSDHAAARMMIRMTEQVR